MDRKELITSLEYVIGEMDVELSSKLTEDNTLKCFRIWDHNKIMRSEFCEKSAVINRLVETCIANGFIPVLKLVPVAEYIAEDERKAKEVKSAKSCINCKHYYSVGPQWDQPYPEHTCKKGHWEGISSQYEMDALSQVNDCVDFEPAKEVRDGK